MTLTVTIKEGSEDTLAGFQFVEGQYIESEEPDDDGNIEVVIDLDDQEDTNAQQEIFLSMAHDVMGWKIE